MPARHEALDWYETPAWYDIIYGEGTSDEADFLEDILVRHGMPGPRRILEPACGSGRLMQALAERGHTVTGFDLSQPMLDYAAARLDAAGQKGTLRRGDLAAFRVPGRFHMAHCLVSTFKYILDEEAARAHLRAVADVLVPGGVYVLGLHITDYANDRRQRERWVATRGGTTVICNVQTWPADRRTRTEQVRSRLRVVEDGGARERRTETVWKFRTYSARQLRALLRTSGAPLQLASIHDFTYDPDVEVTLGADSFDVILVLTRA